MLDTFSLNEEPELLKTVEFIVSCRFWWQAFWLHWAGALYWRCSSLYHVTHQLVISDHPEFSLVILFSSSEGRSVVASLNVTYYILWHKTDYHTSHISFDKIGSNICMKYMWQA